MIKKFDVVVVGAGPCGSSAAYILANSGMSVAIVDKHTFPRDKVCGGLLSGRSKKVFTDIFDQDWESIIEVVSHGAKFYHKDQFLNSLDDYRPIYFTSRYKFDSYLLEFAERKGSVKFLGAKVSSIDKSNNTVILKGGTCLKADFIIGADGVNSRILDANIQDSTFC